MDARTRKITTHTPVPDPDQPDVCRTCQIPLDKPNRRHGVAYRVRRINDGRTPVARLAQPSLF